MALVNRNIWAVVKELILEEYRRDNTANISGRLPEGAVNRFQGLLKTLIDELVQPLDDAAVSLQNIAGLGTAGGNVLDFLGRIVGLNREPGESDSSFRARIVEALGTNDAGTPDRIIKIARSLSRDPEPNLLEEMPATFFIYTPNGFQLSRSQVKQMSPAGVLGLPGASIRQDDGSHSVLADTEGNIMLMVADNDQGYTDSFLLTEDLNEILTESGVCIAVE